MSSLLLTFPISRLLLSIFFVPGHQRILCVAGMAAALHVIRLHKQGRFTDSVFIFCAGVL